MPRNGDRDNPLVRGDLRDEPDDEDLDSRFVPLGDLLVVARPSLEARSRRLMEEGLLEIAAALVPALGFEDALLLLLLLEVPLPGDRVPRFVIRLDNRLGVGDRWRLLLLLVRREERLGEVSLSPRRALLLDPPEEDEREERPEWLLTSAIVRVFPSEVVLFSDAPREWLLRSLLISFLLVCFGESISIRSSSLLCF
mmetsp:Transcript_8778/g.13526  ORF Transcript_8778/g.13526 Transcript_8778/m.13526 type:complete len:197 (-) Transcript_8778:140-730(-)